MEATARKAIIRIECWHAVLLAAMLVAFWRTTSIDATALIAGGVFMGINFFFAELWHRLGADPARKQRPNQGRHWFVGVEDSLFFGIVDDGFFSLSL